MKNNTYKIILSVPYRLLASGLMPTYRREHPEQPATVLPLVFRLSITEKYVKGIFGFAELSIYLMNGRLDNGRTN
jgi:hypothetical protein